MSRTHVRVCCIVEPEHTPTATELADHFEAISDAFYDIEQIQDQSVEADWSRMRMFFDMSIEGSDRLDVVAEAYNYARSAIHASGGYTPGWEDAVTIERHQLERAPEAVCV